MRRVILLLLNMSLVIIAGYSQKVDKVSDKFHLGNAIPADSALVNKKPGHKMILPPVKSATIGNQLPQSVLNSNPCIAIRILAGDTLVTPNNNK